MFASLLTPDTKVKTKVLSMGRTSLVLCFTILLLSSFISTRLVGYRVVVEGIPLIDSITTSATLSTSGHPVQCNYSSLREFDSFTEDTELEHFQLKDWLSESHAPPTVRISSTKGWHTHENICVNNDDGSTRYWVGGMAREKYEQNVSALSLDRTTLPFRPSWLNMSSMNSTQTQVHHLRGKTLVSQCWRNPTANPYHFLYALGKLFSLFTTSAKSQHFDHVVLHQCGNPLKLGYFCEWIWKLVISLGVRRHFISQDTHFFATSTSKSTLFCMDHADVSYDMFAVDHPEALDFKRLVSAELTTIVNLTDVQEPLTAENITCKECFSRLRFALYERPVGDASRRLITNKDEVFKLFRDFSGRFHTISVSKATPIDEVYRKFNSFDVLVTTHGSHMVNLIFTTWTTFAVIEVWGNEVFSPLGEERIWGQVVPFYKTSFPHSSEDAEVEKIIQNFDKTNISHSRKVKTANIRVNTDGLRLVLQDAAEDVCDCKIDTPVL
jgi:hypothetical protein